MVSVPHSTLESPEQLTTAAREEVGWLGKVRNRHKAEVEEHSQPRPCAAEVLEGKKRGRYDLTTTVHGRRRRRRLAVESTRNDLVLAHRNLYSGMSSSSTRPQLGVLLPEIESPHRH